MSKKITKTRLGEGLEQSRTDWNRVDAMRDEDIDYSDIPELDEGFWSKAQLKMPQNKDRITIRLDHDILEWLKQQGEKGYQSRINAILRSYMDAHRRD